MNRNDCFVERLIYRDTAAKAEQDIPTIRPVLTPDMIPDRFHYSQLDKSDQSTSSLGIVQSPPHLSNNNKKDSNSSSKSKSKNNDLEYTSESLPSSIKKVQNYEQSQQRLQQPPPIQPSTTLSPSFSSKDDNLTTNKKNVLSSDDLISGDVDEDNEVSPEVIYKDNVTHGYPLKTKKNGKSSSSSSPSIFTNNNANLRGDGNSRGSGVEILSKPLDQDSSSSSSSILSPISPKKYSPIAESNLGVSYSERTTVTISIGRIDVRAVMQQKPPSSVATILSHMTPSSPALTLNDYLKHRSEGLY